MSLERLIKEGSVQFEGVETNAWTDAPGTCKAPQQELWVHWNWLEQTKNKWLDQAKGKASAEESNMQKGFIPWSVSKEGTSMRPPQPLLFVIQREARSNKNRRQKESPEQHDICQRKALFGPRGVDGMLLEHRPHLITQLW
jgi:hypothetical protein